MISSTVIVACRGARRWFDLDAVRIAHARDYSKEDPSRLGDTEFNRTGHNGAKGSETRTTIADPAGAPPLDWHLDGHTTTPTYPPPERQSMLRYLVGDTRDITATIPDGSVDLVFTSPPFLALRSYLPAEHKDKHREIGSEANPAAFLDVLLALTAEWGRVLAPHGTLAVELGDTYSGSGGAGGDYSNVDGFHAGQPKFRQTKSDAWPLAKSLAGIPQLYMIALAYGINPLTGQPSPAGRWRVRNVIHWHRPNPPVGALGDKVRPATSSITVACRGQRRWFDLDSVRTEHCANATDYPRNQRPSANQVTGSRADDGETFYSGGNPAGAPPLDWHVDGDLGVGHIILSTQPYAGSHYATFPMELPRKIIDCMCPRAVCRVCGVARERVTGEPSYVRRDGSVLDEVETWTSGIADGKGAHATKPGGATKVRVNEQLGWSDCGHDNYRPGRVLDPFVGSGTTLAAAQDLGRDGIGIDIDPRNAELARERCGMFLEVDETMERTPTFADPLIQEVLDKIAAEEHNPPVVDITTGLL